MFPSNDFDEGLSENDDGEDSNRDGDDDESRDEDTDDSDDIESDYDDDDDDEGSSYLLCPFPAVYAYMFKINYNYLSR